MKAAERLEARRLRGEGRSIKEIAKFVGVSKSSVSAWVADIPLTEEHLCELERRQQRSREFIVFRANTLRVAAAERHAEHRRSGFELAAADERFRVICALYWGEGRKTQRDAHFAISNADARLLRVVLQWLLDSGYGARLSFRVQYYPENGYSEEDIKEWWLKQLDGLELKHLRKFTRVAVNRASQQKKTGSLPFGTASIQVCSTELYYGVMGGIDFIAEMGA